MLKARQLFFFFFFSFFHSIGKAGVPGGCFCFWREKKREERGERRRRYGCDVWREEREFYDIILGKREGGRREEKKRREEEREDRIKSAMGILRFCCDNKCHSRSSISCWQIII